MPLNNLTVSPPRVQVQRDSGLDDGEPGVPLPGAPDQDLLLAVPGVGLGVPLPLVRPPSVVVPAEHGDALLALVSPAPGHLVLPPPGHKARTPARGSH